MNNRTAYSPRVEIYLDNIVHNFNQIRNAVPPSIGIMAVVKDNAYGCGSVMISRMLEQLGVDYFAVANPYEARTLRNNGITAAILVLGKSNPCDILWGATADICFVLNDLTDVVEWKSLGCPVRFHIKTDTGMGRLGIAPSQTEELIAAIRHEPLLTVEGVFTHCANADGPDTGSISRQLAPMRRMLQTLNTHGIHPECIHYGNSAAAMRYPLEECTMIRPGIVLYGCKPNPVQEITLDLKPVLALKTHIVKLKQVPALTPVSYGGTYVTTRETTIATIALGYGQGLPRRLSNKGHVLIHGRKYGIAGRVTMDYIMADVGCIPEMAVGDEVVAIGCQGTECITPDEVAAACDTIGYEILCAVSPLIDRLYILNGDVIHHEPARAY